MHLRLLSALAFNKAVPLPLFDTALLAFSVQQAIM